MMRKIFLLLICLILLPPVWASELSPDGEYQYSFSQEEQLPQEQLMPQEEVSLFAPEESDSNNSPLSTYKGQLGPVLKGGVEYKDPNVRGNAVLSRDGKMMTVKARHGLGEFLFGDATSTKDNPAGFMGYHKGRFAITHSFERSQFRQELARNSMTLEPELQLSKNLKFKTSFRSAQSQKGYTQGVALEYGKSDSRFKKVNNLKFELKATTTLSAGSDSVKRFTFNTKYLF